VATINAIHYTGAEPVLVDVESLDNPLMSLEKAAACVTPRTRAVMLMHYAGHLADRDAWREFADRRGLLLIEDAAHAVGVPDVGSYGHAAAFSFYGNKNMTTGEGGMILMRNPALLERARRMRAHGMTSNAHQRLRTRSSQYDVISPGWNYRMDEIRAALGLVQLSRLDSLNDRRAQLAALYRKRLGPLQKRGVLCVPFSRGGVSAHHLFPVVLPARANRDDVMAAMSAQGVQTTIHYPPVHALSCYRSRWPDLKLNVTEEFARREMTLPLHAKMTDSDVDLVAVALEAALGQVSGVAA
jgi:dTDP-4-amino-4,6-dideoxygalactose transaminase